MNFRKGPDNDPFSLRNPDQAVQETAEKILRGASLDGSLRWVHIENGFLSVRKELDHLIDETQGETKCRLMMAVRCVLDGQEEFDNERDAFGEEDG